MFTGDAVHYEDASMKGLIDLAATAEDPTMRIYAAAGLMRGILDTSAILRDDSPFFSAVGWARDAIMDTQAGRDLTDPHADVENYVRGLPAVNGVLDSVSTKATWANKPDATATIIDKHIPKDEAKLVIGLAHGGIVSTLATYAVLEGDNAFYPVRYSIHKQKDSQPVYSYDEAGLLQDLAKDRKVIIHDEDRGMYGNTMKMAIRYMCKFFEKRVYGVTPVMARHPGTYAPEVMWTSPSEQIYSDTYHPYTDKLQEVMDEVARQEAARPLVPASK